jgi:hypothetical protein
MATRQNRMAEFNSGEPPMEQPLEILCQDHCGTYVIPFPCRWENGAWVGVPSNQPINATVLGWRGWAHKP